MVALPERSRRNQCVLSFLLEGEGLIGLKEVLVTRQDRDLSNASIWFVRRGLVRRHQAACGRPLLLDLHGPGDVVCSMAAFGYVDMLRAETGSGLIELPISELATICRRKPEALLTLVAGLARHQDTLRHRLELRSGGRGAAKVTRLLDLLADEIGVPCRHGREGRVDLPALTHQDIADLLSSTRPHVTGLMKSLSNGERLVREGARGLCFLPSSKRSPSRDEEASIDEVFTGT